MSLDKFISTMRTEVAKRFDLKTDAEIDAFFVGLEESARDNQEALEKRDKMLRDTVAELCEAKRLLKAAVEDIHELLCDKDNLDGNGQSCNICSYIERCSCCEECTIREDLRNWRYADVAIELIGEDSDSE